MAMHTAARTTATLVRIQAFALSLAAGVHLGGTASGQIPSALRLEPRGVFATGSTSTFKTVVPGTGHVEYHFKYDGSLVNDDTIEYVIDVDDPDVKSGLLRVYEKSSESFPIRVGGFTWRIADGAGPGACETPSDHKLHCSQVTLFHEYLDPATGVLTLKYKETRNTSQIESRKTYAFWLVGKVLKIHVFADPTVNTRFVDNYDFFSPGASSQAPGAQEQQIPYMDNTPVVRFLPSTHLPATTAFYSISDDYFSSNGVMGDWKLAPSSQPSDGWEQWYPLESRKSSALTALPFQILAVPDETLNLVVTSRIEDTFTVVPNYRSPYYALTAGRMMFFGTRQTPGAWDAYRRQYEDLKNWGLTDVTLIQYMSRRFGTATVLAPMAPAEGSAGVMGCLDSNIKREPGPPVNNCYWVDPFDPDNVTAVQNEFGALADSARNLGALFASTDCESGIDQWGTNEALPPGSVPNSINTYPIARPLHFLGWTVWQGGQPVDVGLDCRYTPLDFDPTWIVRDETGALRGVWDNSVTLNASTCTWYGYGYRTGFVDAHHVFDLVSDQVQYGRDHYRANAVNYDASHMMPDALLIDQTAESPSQVPTKAHTTGDYLKLRTSAVRALRSYMGGPMYGEANYWRWSQAFEYGGRDGFRDGFPISEGGRLDNNLVSWVIPDYDLREVQPKCAGNAGMGMEQTHWAGVTYPVDGKEGNLTYYLDSYITNSATYGHGGFTSNNGNVWANYITDEGILLQYAFLGAISRRMHEGKLLSVKYHTTSGNPAAYDLSHALAAGIDLKNPRIELDFDNGLVLYANHDVIGGSAWQLPTTLPTLSPGVSEQLTIFPNGFAVADGTQLYAFFNGRPTASSGYPFDYVKYANRWEAISNRDSNSILSQQYTGTIYNGFPSSTVINAFSGPDLDLFSEATIYVDARLNVAVGAHGGLRDTLNGWFDEGAGEGASKVTVAALGGPPIPTSLTVSSPAATIYTGKPEGMVARVTYSNHAWQDVTTLATWATTNGGIDQCGAVTASTPGTAVVTANYAVPGGPMMTANLSLTVADGRPSANAGPDLTVNPGTAVAFDASSTADPKQGPVRCDWDFGDGAKAVGAKVAHVFAESSGADRVVTLTVRDVEDHLRTDTANVTVKWNNTAYWWDNFDDGQLGRYSQLAGDLWGVRNGLVQQSKLDANYQELTITGAGHLYGDATAGVEFKLINPVGTNYAGLHVRKTNESDIPIQSGYKAVVSASGVVSLVERGAGGVSQSATIPGFVATARHDLRVVEKRTTTTRVRVYVDGIKYIEATDATPPASGYAGLITYNQASQFDDFHITDNGAPVVTVVPLEYSTTAAASFYIDDQDLFTDIEISDSTSLTLTIKAEDGPLAGATRTFTGWTGSGSIEGIAASPTLTYEPGPSPTWARVTMAQSIETTMNNFDPATKSISYEMIVHDKTSPPATKYTRKYVRYTRP